VKIQVDSLVPRWASKLGSDLKILRNTSWQMSSTSAKSAAHHSKYRAIDRALEGLDDQAKGLEISQPGTFDDHLIDVQHGGHHRPGDL